MNIVAIIQARTGSTRLPRKVLLKLEDKTILEHVVERVKLCKMVNEVVVATTIEEEDGEIVDLCKRNGTRVYCGSRNDVLDRYYQAANIFNADHIVRVTADCPMIDFEIIDSVILMHLEKRSDYTSNSLRETFPNGVDVEVFTMKVLKTAWNCAKLKSEREHVTPYIKKNINRFKLSAYLLDVDLSNKRWTVDNAEDYEFAKQVFARVYTRKPLFVMRDVLEFIENNPQIEKINSHIRRNEGYKKSLANDGLFKEK